MATPRATLYLGDLPSTTEEAMLMKWLEETGIRPVNLKLIKGVGGRYGYAYVNLTTHDDVSTALDSIASLNYTFNDRYVRACRYNPPKNRTGKTNVFVKGLPENTKPTEFYDTFNDFGPVRSIKVVYNDKNVCRGYGFVDFEREEGAEKAINKAQNELKIGNNLLSVVYFKPRSERKEVLINLYVKDFPATYGEDDLKKLFEPYGKIISVVVKEHEELKKKYGFVQFDSNESALKALEELNGKQIDDCELYVGKHLRKEQFKAELREKYRQTNLVIKNPPEEIQDEKDLIRLFEQFGKIRSGKFERNQKGGIGFIAFTTKEEATKAMKDMDNKVTNGVPMRVQLAMTKEERKNLLSQTQIMPQTIPYPYLPSIPYYGQRGLRAPTLPYFPNPQMGYPRQKTGSQMQRRKMVQQPYPVPNPGYPTYAVSAAPRHDVVHQPQTQPVAQPVAAPQPEEPKNEEEEKELRQQYGEEIYAYLNDIEKYSVSAGRLTGIIISSLPMDELRQCVENKELLDKRVEEAFSLLQVPNNQ